VNTARWLLLFFRYTAARFFLGSRSQDRIQLAYQHVQARQRLHRVHLQHGRLHPCRRHCVQGEHVINSRIQFERTYNLFWAEFSFLIYDNDYSSVIDIYFYATFSTLTQTFSAFTQLFRHPVWICLS